MNTITSATILDACEKSLRQDAAKNLEAGDYDSARQIMAWAQNVSDMLAIAQRLAATSATQAHSRTSPIPFIHQSPEHDVTPASPPPLPKESQYPRFARRGTELIKIGWSKQDRKEYTHRCPRSALDAVTAKLHTLAATSSHFTSDDLALLVDPATGTVIPQYQVFVALAWLRVLALIKQPTRKSGYTLLTDQPLNATITAAWPQLPEIP